MKFGQARRILRIRGSESWKNVLGSYIKPDICEWRHWMETSGRYKVREKDDRSSVNRKQRTMSWRVYLGSSCPLQ